MPHHDEVKRSVSMAKSGSVSRVKRRTGGMRVATSSLAVPTTSWSSVRTKGTRSSTLQPALPRLGTSAMRTGHSPASSRRPTATLRGGQAHAEIDDAPDAEAPRRATQVCGPGLARAAFEQRLRESCLDGPRVTEAVPAFEEEAMGGDDLVDRSQAVRFACEALVTRQLRGRRGEELVELPELERRRASALAADHGVADADHALGECHRERGIEQEARRVAERHEMRTRKRDPVLEWADEPHDRVPMPGHDQGRVREAGIQRGEGGLGEVLRDGLEGERHRRRQRERSDRCGTAPDAHRGSHQVGRYPLALPVRVLRDRRSLCMTRLEFDALDYRLWHQRFVPACDRFEGSATDGWRIHRDGVLALELGPGYCLLRTQSCGVCSTDLARQFLPFPLPQVIGHEVIAMGDETGQRFVVEINASHAARGVASACPFCNAGLHTHCPERIVLGIHDLPGGFGPYLLAPIHACVPIPASIPDSAAVLVEPFAAALHAVATIAPRDGERIAVLGPRRLGMLVVAALAVCVRSAGVAVGTSRSRRSPATRRCWSWRAASARPRPTRSTTTAARCPTPRSTS